MLCSLFCHSATAIQTNKNLMLGGENSESVADMDDVDKTGNTLSVGPDHNLKLAPPRALKSPYQK